jgi:hypothetical protein
MGLTKAIVALLLRHRNPCTPVVRRAALVGIALERGHIPKVTHPLLAFSPKRPVAQGMLSNASCVTTNMEAAQRHGIEVVLTSGVGHFGVMEDPQIFNRLLDEAVQKCVHARARQ